MLDRPRALVLDANILIRAVLGKQVRSFIEQYAAEVFLCTPDLCFEEAERYLPEIVARRGGDTEDRDFFGAGIATWTTDRVHLYLVD